MGEEATWGLGGNGYRSPWGEARTGGNCGAAYPACRLGWQGHLWLVVLQGPPHGSSGCRALPYCPAGSLLLHQYQRIDPPNPSGDGNIPLTHCFSPLLCLISSLELYQSPDSSPSIPETTLGESFSDNRRLMLTYLLLIFIFC